MGEELLQTIPYQPWFVNYLIKTEENPIVEPQGHTNLPSGKDTRVAFSGSADPRKARPKSGFESVLCANP